VAGDLDLDVLVEAAPWEQHEGIAECCRAAARIAYLLAAPEGGDAEACLLLSSDEHIRVLNRQWRGIDAATDVLSFPNESLTAAPVHTMPVPAARYLGDVIIAYETAAAAVSDRPFGHHLSHLVVHGILHLLGMDHMTEAEATAMEGLEVRALAQLGIADPYADDTSAPA